MKKIYSFLTVLALGVFAARFAGADGHCMGYITDANGIGVPNVQVVGTYVSGVIPQTAMVEAITTPEGFYDLPVYPEYADGSFDGGTFSIIPSLNGQTAAFSPNYAMCFYNGSYPTTVENDFTYSIPMFRFVPPTAPVNPRIPSPIARPVAPILRGPMGRFAL